MIKSNDLIEEFYKSGDYSHIKLDEFKKICRAEFQMTAKEMSSMNIRKIRLKYLGTFQAYPKRVKYLRDRMIEQYKAGNVPKAFYERLMETYNNFLNRENEN